MSDSLKQHESRKNQAQCPYCERDLMEAAQFALALQLHDKPPEGSTIGAGYMLGWNAACKRIADELEARAVELE